MEVYSNSPAPELLEASKMRISKVIWQRKQTPSHSIEMAQAWGSGSVSLGVDGILASVRDRFVLSQRCQRKAKFPSASPHDKVPRTPEARSYCQMSHLSQLIFFSSFVNCFPLKISAYSASK